ncbi:copper chaperone [Parafilimonas sp.]|uniref:copper chaperone n=1 Tax=Parafilimonas sp. TaxID=1969739 RepID=UPI0039E65F03
MKLKYFLLAVMSICSVSLFAQTKTDTVKVWGNCDECKSKIEKAAEKAGAAKADWSDETYLLAVNYDASKTSVLDIEKAIAAVGYDTQDVRADDAAYKKLPKCCQYSRKPATKAD